MEKISERISRLQQDPLNFTDLKKCVSIARKHSLWQIALSCWETILKSQSESAEALAGRAITLAQLAYFKEAQQAAKEFLAVHPQSKILLITAARIAGMNNNWPLALERWEKVASHYPDNHAALIGSVSALTHMARPQQAVALVHKDCDKRPKTFSEWNALIKISMLLKDFRSALKLSEEARVQFPDEVSLNFQGAGCLFWMHQFESAQDKFSDILKDDPENENAQNWLARVALARQDFDYSILFWQSRCAEDICLPNPLLELSKCYLQMGELDKAEQLLIQVRSNHPRLSQPYQLLKQLLHLQNEPRNSVSLAIQLVRLTPPESGPRLQLATELVNEGRGELVERHVSAIFASIQNKNFAHMLLLKIFFATKQFARLEEHYDAISPESPIYKQNRAFLKDVLKVMGRISEANRLSVELAVASSDIPCRFFDQLESLQEIVGKFDSQQGGVQARREFEAAANSYSDLVPLPFTLWELREISSSDAIKKLVNLAQRKDHQRFLKVFDETFNDVSKALSNMKLLSGFLLMKFQSLEALDRKQDALAALTLAVEYAKQDRHMLQLYQQKLIAYSEIPTMDWMTAPTPLISITSCRANFSKAKLLLDGIREFIHYPAIIICADETQSHFSVTNDTLTVPCSDDYLALPAKIMSAFQFFYLFTKCRSVLKIDDDVFIKHGERFKALLEELSLENIDYLGRLNHNSDSGYHFAKASVNEYPLTLASQRPLTFCDGGFGYHLSRSALKSLFEQNAWYPHFLQQATYEDMLIAELLSLVEISPQERRLDIKGGYIAGIFEGLPDLFRQVSPG